MKTENQLAKKATEQRASNIKERVLKMPDTEQMIGLKRSSIYNKFTPKSRYYDPTFPKPIKLGARAIGWFESDIQAWLESRKEV